MRIALTHPSCWPYVRRGAERFLSELGAWLATRGHEVITISSIPSAARVEQTPEGLRILGRQLFHPMLRRFRVQPYHSFFLPAARSLFQTRPDLIQSLHYVDALAGVVAGRKTGSPAVYYVTGPPVPHHLPRVPPDRWLLRQAIVRSDAVLVPSRHVADIVEEYYHVKPIIAPVPIHAARFAASNVPKSVDPLILSVSAVDDVRKGSRPLLQAFARVKECVPEARLRICADTPPGAREFLLQLVPAAVHDSIEFTGPGSLEDLPAQYRQAWITVLPSKWEAYGLVLLESWAAGTPVVATNHAALPELVDDARIGVRFEPGQGGQEVTDIEALANAMIAGLKLSGKSETAELCREKAGAYTWERLGPAYERIYSELLSAAESRSK